MIEPETLALAAGVVIPLVTLGAVRAGWCRCRRFKLATWFAVVVAVVLWNWAWALATVFFAALAWLVPCKHRRPARFAAKG